MRLMLREVLPRDRKAVLGAPGGMILRSLLSARQILRVNFSEGGKLRGRRCKLALEQVWDDTSLVGDHCNFGL